MSQGQMLRTIVIVPSSSNVMIRTCMEGVTRLDIGGEKRYTREAALKDYDLILLDSGCGKEPGGSESIKVTKCLEGKTMKRKAITTSAKTES